MSFKQKTLPSVVLIGVAGLLLYLTSGHADKSDSINTEENLVATSRELVTTVEGSPPPQTSLKFSPFIGGTTLPEIRTRVRRQVENLVRDPSSPDLDGARFRRAFEAYVNPTLAATISPTSPDQDSGKTMAKGCDPLGSEALMIFTSLQENGEVPFASGPIEQEALLGMFSILIIQAGAGGREIPVTLEGLASRLPPTRADYFVCVAAREALQVVNRTSGPLRSEELAAWMRLATARNPVYRGLALLGASKVCMDQEQLTTIYSSFRHESDPELFRRAIERLGQFPNTNARLHLESFREDALNTGRNDTLIMLDDALRQQSKAAKLKAFYEEK